MKLIELDSKLVSLSKKLSSPVSRIAIFTVYFWFGALKVLNLSPATPLVHELFNKTLPFLNFDMFLVGFGIFECIIGVLFLIKGLERLATLLIFGHLVTTVMPLFLLAGLWSGFLIPTMEAQYIIKNILIVAVVLNIASKIKE